MDPESIRACGRAIDIDVEFFPEADAYLLRGVTPAGIAFLAEEIDPKSPRHRGRIICEPKDMSFLALEAEDAGLCVA